MLSEKTPDLLDSRRVKVESAVKEKNSNYVSTNFAAHIRDTYSIGNSCNSLSVQSHTQQIFEYSKQPTGSRNKIMQQVEEVGVYIPQSMSNNWKMSHVFAMHNLDCKKKK